MDRFDRIATRVAQHRLYLQLADRIERFLKEHGIRGHDGKWNGPDSDMLDSAAKILRNGVKPGYPWSDWNSGCYQPYNDLSGKREHDAILSEIKKLK